MIWHNQEIFNDFKGTTFGANSQYFMIDDVTTCSDVVNIVDN